MRNFIYLFLIITFFTACGGGSDSSNNDTENMDAPEGFQMLDLTPWGFEMTIMVPDAQLNGEHEVVLNERGTLEIYIGSSFGIEIMFGEGDIELLKTDLNEDLVFTAEIVKEEADALVYKQSIPNAEVKVQNHFFYKKQIKNDIYEIRDLIDGEYSLEMIEKMLSASRTIKYKAITSAEAA